MPLLLAAIVLSALLLLGAVFYAKHASTRALGGASAPLTDDGAREVAQLAVRELLGPKAGAGAKFPALRDMEVIRRRDRALVRSHVDARDRFGITRRLDFLVEFKPSPKRDFWALENWRLGTRRSRP